ncbi:hypothetical protein [uncultured Paracoccus sp.]|uniref:hypothetical protein n=1 Tax=uncultured Paracoccus sp. TaxID=189685 RepID=UPI00163DA105|nr:hypothetical protein [uncultured Paracoccus sp.]
MNKLIERHGTATVLFALIATIIRRRPRRANGVPVTMLSPHLRRDIGLPPHCEERPRHWDIRH